MGTLNTPSGDTPLHPYSERLLPDVSVQSRGAQIVTPKIALAPRPLPNKGFYPLVFNLMYFPCLD